MTPARRLLVELVELVAHRARETDFDTAWAAALDLALAGEQDRDWRSALEETRDRWQAAYVGEPVRRPELALVVVASDPDRVALDDPGARRCQWCYAPIPAARKGGAKFCCDGCRRRHHHRWEAERAAA